VAAEAAPRRIISVVRSAFEEILGPLYAAARYERMPLFEHYQFSPQLAPAVRTSVAAVIPDSGRKVLHFPGGMSLPNISEFYEKFLAHHPRPQSGYARPLTWAFEAGAWRRPCAGSRSLFVRLWERDGSGDSLAGAVRRGQTQPSCPAQVPLTCRNAADQRSCRAARSVRDEETAGSNLG
jgi:hypothetical protein